MHAILALAILALQYCEVCLTIKVPVVWDGDKSEVKASEHEFSVNQFKPLNLRNPVPINYFEYTAKKPSFAVDIATFHGVQFPENHYKSYPVRPFTGIQQPILGKHKIQDVNRPVFQHFQKFLNQDNQPQPDITPALANYEVFHPYKVEEHDLKNLYKDPVLDKIRNDIRESSQRLQKHENEASKSDITKDEYLESLEQTDIKKRPQQNVPAHYENHRPQRKPIYYQPYHHHSHRDHILNQRFKHPWNQNFVKIRPQHYRPLRNHLNKLRQHHALTYDDERNEYPQVPVLEAYQNPTDGYDIYEKGQEKYKTLRNNLDESINNLVKENHPLVSQRLELQNNETPIEEEDEFVPVKTYAQVRKTESTKHLPKEAAFDDAETYEEIKNAPRLREAIKSTKAQTVYTEEGYEDSAYDHAGEQKHASDHEAHGGFLREKERSGGKYKAPSVSASFDDGGGSAYKDQLVDAKKWTNNKKNTEQEDDSEDYTENEHENSQETDTYNEGLRNKRQESYENDGPISNSDDDDENDAQSGPETSGKKNITLPHDLNKRETNFQVPAIDLDSTFLNEKDILEIAKEKLITKTDWQRKYPYYFKSAKQISKDSPLRYAENLKLMPLKSKGGTEFYDSRSQLECPEVDERVNAIPNKLKKEGHPDEPEEGAKEEESEPNQNSENREDPPRLQGLGDKIDCFKAKYFGEDPLDSPFFKEDIIANPEPILMSDILILKPNYTKINPSLESSFNNFSINSESKSNNTYNTDIYNLLGKLQSKQSSFQNVKEPRNISDVFKSLGNSSLLEESQTFYDVLQNIKNNLHLPLINKTYLNHDINSTSKPQNQSINDFNYNNENNTNTQALLLRHRRSSPFLYEPYKIIRNIQPPETKKTTTINNMSPLIKQLQSNTAIDTKVKQNKENDNSTIRNIQSRTYKDIGRIDREKKFSSDLNTSSSFVDVSVDSRRGEPRYELRPANHKNEYTPVVNKKSMSIQDYEHESQKFNNSDNTQKRPSARSLFNIANNYKNSEELHNLLASSSNRRTVNTSPSPNVRKIETTQSNNDNDSEEEYDEDYEDELEDEEEISTTSTTTTTTTTSTPKPLFRRRIKLTTTTEQPKANNNEEPMRLRLVTRFRNTPTKENIKRTQNHSEKSTEPENENDDESLAKYREKKKKSSKSTIVTDIKRYGSDEDNKKKEKEIDDLIGVKHDMKEYMPSYEKDIKNDKDSSSSSEEDESDESYEDEGEDDVNEDFSNEEEIEEEEQEQQPNTTTAPKRTLARTTDAPPSTTEGKSFKLIAKPVISKKKIEVHKELPVNKSSPHHTQFRQDIEEVEIVKEIPRKALNKKQNKNLELLDLYKDDNLATDINKLGAVEVFKEDLDLKNGPKHGGNYKQSLDVGKSSSIPVKTNDKKPKDTETSQTENKKLIELDDTNTRTGMHGGNLKSISDIRRSRGNTRNAKLVEFSKITERPEKKSLHSGNLKSINDRNRRRGGSRSEKLIELDDQKDDEDDDSTTSMHGGNFRSYGGPRSNGKGLHGGNYRSSKLIQANDNVEQSSKPLENAKGDTDSIMRINSADLLNIFAQAVPILTTTPAYILDPSKRMYYYVD